MDDSRRYDLEELMEKYKYAPNGMWRDYYGKVITKIMRESGAIREEREALIEAIRAGDRRRVRYVQERLRKLDKDRTGGKETVKI